MTKPLFSLRHCPVMFQGYYYLEYQEDCFYKINDSGAIVSSVDFRYLPFDLYPKLKPYRAIIYYYDKTRSVSAKWQYGLDGIVELPLNQDPISDFVKEKQSANCRFFCHTNHPDQGFAQSILIFS